MTLKDRIKPYVPPIVWARLARARTNGPGGNAGFKRSIVDIAAGENFSIDFSKATQDGKMYFVPKYAEHRPACHAILRGEIYEPDTHAFVHDVMNRKSGSMVHAGTFFGDMLPNFSRSCPGTVYAFEPVLENYVLAKLCIESNKLENVYLQNAGLGQEISIVHINTGNQGQSHRGGSSHVSKTGQLVGLVTIDSLGLDDIVLIQLDVEGYELPALKGARSTIERNTPIIMIEDNSRNCNSFLGEIGYEYIGEIPGLSIWSRPCDRAMINDILSR